MKQKGAELWQQQEEKQDIEQRDIQERTLYLADSQGVGRCMCMEVLWKNNRFCREECRNQDRYMKLGQAVRCVETAIVH